MYALRHKLPAVQRRNETKQKRSHKIGNEDIQRKPVVLADRTSRLVAECKGQLQNVTVSCRMYAELPILHSHRAQGRAKNRRVEITLTGSTS
jgi:hypothetical protein